MLCADGVRGQTMWESTALQLQQGTESEDGGGFLGRKPLIDLATCGKDGRGLGMVSAFCMHFSPSHRQVLACTASIAPDKDDSRR
jgi:hypothetical protein